MHKNRRTFFLAKYSKLEYHLINNELVTRLIKPCQIELTKNAQKDLLKMPHYIKEKLLLWVDSVERLGLNKIKEIPGYHDEALKGDRKGQRSIRLNKAYRAIYVENEQKEIIIISIIEVNKHEY